MKSRSVYTWLCILGGFFGLHKFYIEKYGMGILYMFTFGLFLFGWIHDMLHINGDIDRYNTQRGHVKIVNQ